MSQQQHQQQPEAEGGEPNVKLNAKKVLPRAFFLLVMLVAAVTSNLTYSKFTSPTKATSMYKDQNQEVVRTLHLRGGGNESLTGENGQEEHSVTSKDTVTSTTVETDESTEESATDTVTEAPVVSSATEAPVVSSARKADNETQTTATTTATTTTNRTATTTTAPYEHLNDGAFIHLGKTGGSSLAGFMRNACHSFVGRPCPHHSITNTTNETAVSLKMQHYYHIPDFPKLAQAPAHDFYIVTLRDPYERIRSSFVYSHPANEKTLIRSGAARYPDQHWKKLRKWHGNSMANLTKCFPTLEQFVQNLGDGNQVQFHNYTYPVGPNEIYQEDCTDFARATMDHKFGALPHLYWNLEHIYELMGHAINKNKTVIFASRKEHIVQDWESTNKLLGEQKDTTQLWPSKKTRDVSKIDLPVPNELSEEGRVQLCRALRGEYLRHVQFLQASVNVSPEDKEEYIRLSRKNCGDQLDFL